VIPGGRNPQQVKENAAAANTKLSKDELDRIAELWRTELSKK